MINATKTSTTQFKERIYGNLMQFEQKVLATDSKAKNYIEEIYKILDNTFVSIVWLDIQELTTTMPGRFNFSSSVSSLTKSLEETLKDFPLFPLLRIELKDLQTQRLFAEHKIHSLETDNTSLKRSYEELNQKIQISNPNANEIMTLKRELSTAKAALDLKSTELETTKDANNALIKKCQDLTSMFDTLKNQNEALTQQQLKQEQDIDKLEKHLQDVEKKNADSPFKTKEEAKIFFKKMMAEQEEPTLFQEFKKDIIHDSKNEIPIVTLPALEKNNFTVTEESEHFPQSPENSLTNLTMPEKEENLEAQEQNAVIPALTKESISEEPERIISLDYTDIKSLLSDWTHNQLLKPYVYPMVSTYKDLAKIKVYFCTKQQRQLKERLFAEYQANKAWVWEALEINNSLEKLAIFLVHSKGNFCRVSCALYWIDAMSLDADLIKTLPLLSNVFLSNAGKSLSTLSAESEAVIEERIINKYNPGISQNKESEEQISLKEIHTIQKTEREQEAYKIREKTVTIDEIKKNLTLLNSIYENLKSKPIKTEVLSEEVEESIPQERHLSFRRM